MELWPVVGCAWYLFQTASYFNGMFHSSNKIAKHAILFKNIPVISHSYYLFCLNTHIHVTPSHKMLSLHANFIFRLETQFFSCNTLFASLLFSTVVFMLGGYSPSLGGKWCMIKQRYYEQSFFSFFFRSPLPPPDNALDP